MVEKDNRYTMFRNFMANELSITREDIKQWTAEAIAQQVQKIVGQMDVKGIIERNAKLSYGDVQAVKTELTKKLAERIDIDVR